jgi:hypothetical protein
VTCKQASDLILKRVDVQFWIHHDHLSAGDVAQTFDEEAQVGTEVLLIYLNSMAVS